MAETIEITDLLNPVLTEMQRAALQATAAQPVNFSQIAVLEAARAQTGLSDFGPPEFRDRLDIWLKAIDEDAEASSVTRASLFQMCCPVCRDNACGSRISSRSTRRRATSPLTGRSSFWPGSAADPGTTQSC